MPQAKTIIISQNNDPFASFDFKAMRELGLKHLGELSGELWTDHNTHDPGITILEALIYALMDLGYRSNLPIEDLLARDKSKQPKDDLYFTAAQLLGCNPVTELDYRKLLIDIPGVRNAWLEKVGDGEVPIYLACDAADAAKPCVPGSTGSLATSGLASHNLPLSGLYKVWLEIDPVRPQDEVGQTGKSGGDSLDRILKETWRRLHAHRNLCEDFVDVCILQEEQIGLCAAIEIAPDANVEDVLTEMFTNLRKFLSPPIPFYSLKALKAKGKSMEEIFAGRPMLIDSHGFVDVADLPLTGHREALHISDFYQVMLGTPGVTAIRNMKAINYIGGLQQSNGEEWVLKLTKGFHPVIAPDLGKLLVYKEGIQIGFDKAAVTERVAARLTDQEKSLRTAYDLDNPYNEGRYIPDLGEYYSIQNDFPNVYGIGEGGLLPDATPRRRSQAYQLKAYLLFFDQLLANFLANLANIRAAFSLQPSGGLSTPAADLSSVPDLSLLVRGSAPDSLGDPITGTEELYRYGSMVMYPYQAQNDSEYYDGYQLFASPDTRDAILRQAQSAFQAGEGYSIGTLTDDCGNHLFELRFNIAVASQGEALVLRSGRAYKTEAAARQEAESLAFLGLQPENFRPLNLAKQRRYGFEVVYQSRKYDDFIKQLAAPGDTALRRRDQFVNHLLARFNEDFTEYALLAYAAQNDPSQPDSALLNDKEQFLHHYADISRNRGKAFDYSLQDKLWNSKNISGLEARVLGLMGVDEWERKTLATFDVSEKTVKSSWVLRDFRGCCLLETTKRYDAKPPLPDSTNPEDRPLLEDLSVLFSVASKSSNYYSFDNADCGVFGFEIKNPAGCLLAQHPHTYGTASLRDSRLHHIQKLFEGGGLHKEIIETKGGWVFQLFEGDSPGAKLLLESAQPVEAENDALVRLQWLEVQKLGIEEANWQFIAHPHSDGHSFALVKKNGEKIEQIAIHPHFYKSLAEAQTALDDLICKLSESRLDARILQRPTEHIWQLKNDQGLVLIESRHSFAMQEQACLALVNALELAADLANYEPFQDEDNWKFSFRLVQDLPPDDDQPGLRLLLATHPCTYHSESEMQGMLQATADAAKAANDFTKRLVPRNNAMRFRLCDEQGVTLLDAMPIFTDTNTLQVAWTQFLERASQPANYHVTEDGDFGVWLDDGCGGPLAIVPSGFKNEAAAKAFISSVTAFIYQQKPQPEIDLLETAYAFRLLGVDGRPALISTAWFGSKMEAKAAYFKALADASLPENWEVVGEKGKYRVALNGAGAPCCQPLATSIEQFPDRPAAEACIMNWSDFYQNTPPPVALLGCAGRFYLEIWKEGNLALSGAAEFATATEAGLLLEKIIERGCDTDHFAKRQEGCRATFDLTDGEHGPVLATHPVWYLDPLEMAASIAALSACLCAAKLPVIYLDKQPSFNWELVMETCDEQLVTALVGLGNFGSAQAALDDANNYLHSPLSRLEVDNGPSGDGPFGMNLSSAGQLVATHPLMYTTQAGRDEARKELYLYLGQKNTQTANDWWKWEASTEENLGASRHYFRLDKNPPLATLAYRFSEKADRGEAMKALVEKGRCRQLVHSSIDFGGQIFELQGKFFYQLKSGKKLWLNGVEGYSTDLSFQIFESNAKFFYQLKSGKMVWWQSIEAHATREEATAAFYADFLNILRHAADPDLYLAECADSVACWFWLLDEHGLKIARTPDFPTGQDLSDAFEERLYHARTYPVFQIGDRFCFQLYDRSQRRRLLVSTGDYPSHDQALQAFGHVLTLLADEVNIRPVDNLLACWFSIEVVEAGLEGVELFEAPTNPQSDDLVPPENQQEILAWQALDRHLGEFGDKNRLFVLANRLERCRFGLLWAKNEWEFARLTRYYHTPADRAADLDEIFQQLCCGNLRFDGKFCFGYFLKSALQLPFDPCFGSWKMEEQPSLEKLDAVKCCQGTEELPNPADLVPAEVLVELTEYARAADFYVKIAELDPNKCGTGQVAYRLGLMDEAGELLALGNTLHTDEPSWEAERDEAIRQAWKFPIVRRGKRYGFQVAAGVEDVLVEGTQERDNFYLAWQDYLHFQTLVCDKRNYGWSEAKDCGPFGIVINDPTAIIATHPANYFSRARVCEVQGQLEGCLGVEGIHLVEHLLLRPRIESNQLLSVSCLACEDCAGLVQTLEDIETKCHEDCLSPSDCLDRKRREVLRCGADPYSFQATVLLPYWPQRFRRLNFRSFFEKTIRQEAPAHVALRIIWLDALGMRRFETAYRAWLSARALGDQACAGTTALQSLVSVLDNLKNTYPKNSRLTGSLTEDESELIVLDFSSLSH